LDLGLSPSYKTTQALVAQMKAGYDTTPGLEAIAVQTQGACAEAKREDKTTLIYSTASRRLPRGRLSLDRIRRSRWSCDVARSLLSRPRLYQLYFKRDLSKGCLGAPGILGCQQLGDSGDRRRKELPEVFAPEDDEPRFYVESLLTWASELLHYTIPGDRLEKA
jgi:hypothetical protein